MRRSSEMQRMLGGGRGVEGAGNAKFQVVTRVGIAPILHVLM